MGAEANTVASLLEKLKVDDPWVPPKPWESIPSEGGGSRRCSSNSRSSSSFYNVSNLSESSLVRLVMNALQGVESALVAVDQFSALFCSDSADRTFHRISSLWTWSSSTHSLGNLLKSIGQFGCIVFLLQKFVEHFTHLNPDGDSGSEEISQEDIKDSKDWPRDTFGVVNQAFTVAVKKILDSYISALNTLYASVSLRRALKNSDGGCLTNVGNSEITVLEVYLHTKGLRTQIEALGDMCQLCDIARRFSRSPFEDLIVAANLEFTKFPRGAMLLTYLYTQLKVVDTIHFTLLKFLFLQSFEPYYRFIRSWIYEGRMSDPYKEFVMEFDEHLSARAQGKAGTSTEFLCIVTVRDGVTLPCFLEDFLIPLLRVGQQLQVLMKLLELCYGLGAYNNAQEEILPFLDNPPNDYPFFASPLTFHKETIEKMVLARNSYYQRMLEKVENIFTRVEFKSAKASPSAIEHLFATNYGSSLKPADSIFDDGLVPVVMDERDKKLPDNIVENDARSTADEFSDAEDIPASSESSSVTSFQEQNDAEQLPNVSMQFQPSYLSSLSFSFFAESSVQIPSQHEFSCSAENFISEVCEKTQKSCQGMNTYHDVYHEGRNESVSSLSLQFGKKSVLLNADTETFSDETDLRLQPVCILDSVNIGNDSSSWFHMSGSVLDARNRIFGDWKTGVFHFSDTIFPRNGYPETTNNKWQQSNISCALLSSVNLQSWNIRYDSIVLSRNPALSKACWINSSNKPGNRCSNYKEPMSCFGYPCKVCEEKLASFASYQPGIEHSILTDTNPDATINASDNHGSQNCSYENSVEELRSSMVNLSSDSNVGGGKDALCANNYAGGSKWESLLACFGNNSNFNGRGYRTSSVALFDVPLDYVIKKCLWEEILLQYQYVSKLTLKLLEEGFDLQEHLLALRRYHFMELADWADLFIFSLWHHKWHVTDLNKRILEIQGVLELSIQRSSCEGDINKDRLYVYLKGDFVMPLSASAKGICSFDFLGLGYRVDWPVSIILTPGALKIYSNIFNFLIQVKLAIFSLSDVWCSLKGLIQVTRQSCPSERLKLTLQHISVLTETRHQVNHFVSTLQQYVQSQLFHVSWCKFLKSLKHKVKDMMDFGAVHMEYLTESLQICFLSEETQSIANIIQSMLQCSIGLRSCLFGCTMDVGPSGKDSSEPPQIDILQVLEIKKTFRKNVDDLFLIYLKSPKNGEFGLSRFWDYLNYNDYYVDDRGVQLCRGLYV